MLMLNILMVKHRLIKKRQLIYKSSNYCIISILIKTQVIITFLKW